jgi:hypothetical protein
MFGTLPYYTQQLMGQLIKMLCMWCGLTAEQCAMVVARMETLNADGATPQFRIPTADETSPKLGTWMTNACTCPRGRTCLKNFTLAEIANASVDYSVALGELPIQRYCTKCASRLGNLANLFHEIHQAHTKFAVPECDLAPPAVRERVAGAFRTLTFAFGDAAVSAPVTALLECADLIAQHMAKDPFAAIGE